MRPQSTVTLLVALPEVFFHHSGVFRGGAFFHLYRLLSSIEAQVTLGYEKQLSWLERSPNQHKQCDFLSFHNPSDLTVPLWSLDLKVGEHWNTLSFDTSKNNTSITENCQKLVDEFLTCLATWILFILIYFQLVWWIMIPPNVNTRLTSLNFPKQWFGI